MTQSVAVAIVHGIGRQREDFASAIIRQLRRRVAQKLGADPAQAPRFFFQPVYWAPVLQNEEDDLWSRLRKGGRLGWTGLREFMVDFAADAIAYQPIQGRISMTRQDVIGYPLKELNGDYRREVTSDRRVLAGGPFAFWNPLSHLKYFGDTDVLGPIAEGLVGVWQTINR